MTAKQRLLSKFSNRNALWTWMLTALISALLYLGLWWQAERLIQQQAKTISTQWHQLASTLRADSNQHWLQQLKALQANPHLAIIEVYSGQDLRQLIQLNQTEHASAIKSTVLTLGQQQRRSNLIHWHNLEPQSLLLSTNRLAMPQTLDNQRVYAVLILGLDTAPLRAQVMLHFHLFFGLLMLALLLMVSVITARQRWLFTEPLRRLVTDTIWQRSYANSNPLSANYRSSLLASLAQQINHLGATNQTSEAQLHQAQHQRKQLSQRLHLSRQLTEQCHWQVNVHSGEFEVKQQDLHHLGLQQLPEHLHINDFYQRLHPDDINHVKAQFEAARRHHSTMEFTARLINHNNEMRYIKCVAAMAMETDPAWLIGQSIDITEQYRQQQALRLEQVKVQDAENKLQTLMEVDDVGIVQIDQFGTILQLNSAGHRLLGYASQTLLGQNATVLVPQEKHTTPKRQPLYRCQPAPRPTFHH
ncbi:PAS domain-containing protein [uncultured Ferrimonas sp.]|uniref:PAS domain-containing protein n=1 Tax=uncultured Ferrimonas sp. TaxID=432640 RepID=UPI0026119F01|nr:PAS domain-containing protein [uncultured Ferrimonas sp.]